MLSDRTLVDLSTGTETTCYKLINECFHRPAITCRKELRRKITHVSELMTQLGHGASYMRGENRKVEYAYIITALYRDRNLRISFWSVLSFPTQPPKNSLEQ